MPVFSLYGEIRAGYPVGPGSSLQGADRPIFFYVPAPHRVVCRTMKIPGTVNSMVFLPAESVHPPLIRTKRQQCPGSAITACTRSLFSCSSLWSRSRTLRGSAFCKDPCIRHTSGIKGGHQPGGSRLLSYRPGCYRYRNFLSDLRVIPKKIKPANIPQARQRIPVTPISSPAMVRGTKGTADRTEYDTRAIIRTTSTDG